MEEKNEREIQKRREKKENDVGERVRRRRFNRSINLSLINVSTLSTSLAKVGHSQPPLHIPQQKPAILQCLKNAILVVSATDTPHALDIVRAVAAQHILVVAGVVHEAEGEVCTPLAGNVVDCGFQVLYCVSGGRVGGGAVVLDAGCEPYVG